MCVSDDLFGAKREEKLKYLADIIYRAIIFSIFLPAGFIVTILRYPPPFILTTPIPPFSFFSKFLKAAAAKGRKIRVIVCEGAPHFSGHAMARSLADSGIGTTVIHDSAAFAVMARVNKVLLPAHAVLVSDDAERLYLLL